MIDSKYKNAGDGIKELNEDYEGWSSMLTSYSLQISYAIIAANWAVHSSTDNLLKNGFAKGSLIIIFIFLGLNLLASAKVTKLLYQRIFFAEENSEKWSKEFEDYEKGDSKHWPFSSEIHNIPDLLRHLKVWMPIVSAGFFIFSLF